MCQPPVTTPHTSPQLLKPQAAGQQESRRAQGKFLSRRGLPLPLHRGRQLWPRDGADHSCWRAQCRKRLPHQTVIVRLLFCSKFPSPLCHLHPPGLAIIQLTLFVFLLYPSHCLMCCLFVLSPSPLHPIHSLLHAQHLQQYMTCKKTLLVTVVDTLRAVASAEQSCLAQVTQSLPRLAPSLDGWRSSIWAPCRTTSKRTLWGWLRLLVVLPLPTPASVSSFPQGLV